MPVYGDAAEVERLRARMELAGAATNAKDERRAKRSAAAAALADDVADSAAKRAQVETINAGIDTRAIVQEAEARTRTRTDAVKSLFTDPSKQDKTGKPNWVSMGTHVSYIS